MTKFFDPAFQNLLDEYCTSEEEYIGSIYSDDFKVNGNFNVMVRLLGKNTGDELAILPYQCNHNIFEDKEANESICEDIKQYIVNDDILKNIDIRVMIDAVH